MSEEKKVTAAEENKAPKNNKKLVTGVIVVVIAALLIWGIWTWVSNSSVSFGQSTATVEGAMIGKLAGTMTEQKNGSATAKQSWQIATTELEGLKTAESTAFVEFEFKDDEMHSATLFVKAEKADIQKYLEAEYGSDFAKGVGSKQYNVWTKGDTVIYFEPEKEVSEDEAPAEAPAEEPAEPVELTELEALQAKMDETVAAKDAEIQALMLKDNKEAQGYIPVYIYDSKADVNANRNNTFLVK